MAFMAGDGEGRIVSHLVVVDRAGVLFSGCGELETLPYQTPLLDPKLVDLNYFSSLIYESISQSQKLHIEIGMTVAWYNGR
jgi:hypothetical protein